MKNTEQLVAGEWAVRPLAEASSSLRSRLGRCDFILANWEWITDVPAGEDLLLVLLGRGNPVVTVGDHFSRTFVLESLPAPQGGKRAVRNSPLASDDQTFDCIVLTDSDRSDSSRQKLEPLLAGLRQVLRPSDGLFLGFEVIPRPWSVKGGWNWRNLMQRDLVRSAQKKGLQRAGFQGIEEFYLVLWADGVQGHIPATRHAVIAWENVLGPGGFRGVARRFLAGIGLHWLLFEHRFFIARP